MSATTQQWVAFVVLVIALAVVVGGVWAMLFGGSQRAPADTEQFPAIDEPTERIPKYQEPRFKLLVVAGTHRQYEEYCAELGLNRYHDALFVDSPWKVRGLRDHKYVLVGTWWERPNLAELQEELAFRGCTLI